MYLLIKHFHITCVVLSGAGFLLRGWWSVSGSPLLAARLTKRLPHVIDSCLLASAIALAWMAGQYPLVHGWLTAKVLLLVVYIVLGVFALRRGRTPASRAGFFIAALAVYLFIVSIALAHDPRGIFAYVIN